MTTSELKEKLMSGNSTERLRATKHILKTKARELCDVLLLSYINEKRNSRTWELQSEMIKVLGALDYKPAMSEVESIVRANLPYDTRTISAAVAFVELTRKDIHDAQPVLTLLSTGSISVITGALKALAIDKMLPSKHDAEIILKIGWDINKHKDRVGREFGLVDPRIYLAVACAGWEVPLSTSFLHHCISTATNINSSGNPVKNAHLIQVCEQALRGKYSSIA